MSNLRKKPILYILIAFTAAEVFRHSGWMLFYEQFKDNSDQDINIAFIYYTMAITVVSFIYPVIVSRLNYKDKYKFLGNMYGIFFVVALLLRIAILFLPYELANVVLFMSTAAIEVCIMICLVLVFQLASPFILGRFVGIAYFTDTIFITVTEHYSRTNLYFPISITISVILCMLALLISNQQLGQIKLSAARDVHPKSLPLSVYRLVTVILIIYVLIAGLTDNLYFFEDVFELPSIYNKIRPISAVMYLLSGLAIDKVDRKKSLIVAFVMICIAQSMRFFVRGDLFGIAYILISDMGSFFLELITLIIPMIYMRKKGVSTVGVGEGMFYGSFCITSILFVFITQDAYIPIMGIILIGGISCLILLIALIIILHNNELMESQLNLQNIRIEHQSAVIVSLKKQINAHFTVNSLNLVRALIKKNENDRAEEICEGISGLLQYANAGDETITVLDEFSMLERYLAIMRTRYPGKFTANLEFDDELAEVKIPRMLLQPLVENAILHGFGRQEEGDLNVLCDMGENTVVLSVSDNGCGMEKQSLEALKEYLQCYTGKDIAPGLSHVALPNIQKRLQTSYGANYGVTIESQLGKGTKVTLVIPNITD